MQRFGMILDLSHMAEEACLEALEWYSGPVIADALHDRGYPDDDIENIMGRNWQCVLRQYLPRQNARMNDGEMRVAAVFPNFR